MSYDSSVTTLSTQPSMTRQDVEILARDSVFKGFFSVDKLSLRHRLYEGGWSNPFTRELFRRGRAAGVLLHDPQRQQLVLVEQFRVGLIDDGKRSPWVLELVAGIIDGGETQEELAAREVREETGLSVSNLQFICEYYNSPGGSDEIISLFYGQVDATQAGGIHGLAEENEDIKVVVMDLDEVWQALDSGVFNNAMAIIALQWLRLHLTDAKGSHVRGDGS